MKILRNTKKPNSLLVTLMSTQLTVRSRRYSTITHPAKRSKRFTDMFGLSYGDQVEILPPLPGFVMVPRPVLVPAPAVPRIIIRRGGSRARACSGTAPTSRSSSRARACSGTTTLSTRSGRGARSSCCRAIRGNQGGLRVGRSNDGYSEHNGAEHFHHRHGVLRVVDE
jgi:hypothetical protein